MQPIDAYHDERKIEKSLYHTYTSLFMQDILSNEERGHGTDGDGVAYANGNTMSANLCDFTSEVKHKNSLEHLTRQYIKTKLLQIKPTNYSSRKQKF